MSTLLERPPLAEFIHGDPPEQTGDGFVIHDDRSASWAASRILAARRRVTSRSRLAEEYQTRILNWLQEANRADLQSTQFLEASLRPWVENEVAQLGRVKSFRLPGARVGLRKKPDRVEISDQESVLAFCQENMEEVIVIKRDLSKTELKRHLVQGARIPGAELVAGNEELTVSED